LAAVDWTSTAAGSAIPLSMSGVLVRTGPGLQHRLAVSWGFGISYGPVVNVQDVAAMGLPAVSLIPVVSAAVNVVFAGRVAFGLSVATWVVAL